MHFESATPSIVRSIRQRDFLNEWIRLYMRTQQLPVRNAFLPARIEDEMPELVFYDVETVDGVPHYRITHEGDRLIDSYGVSGIDRVLQETIDPAVWFYLEPIYQTCITTRLPIYTIFNVDDIEGRRVDYERLLLPFGEAGRVINMIASLKSISSEGRFVNKDLMRPADHDPQYTLRAVIDRDLVHRMPPRRGGDDNVIDM
jgi:hypothetical protein